MAPRSKQIAREFRLEQLENRFLCSRDGVPFSGYGSLTFSVAPDGAHVGNQVSSLQTRIQSIGIDNAVAASIGKGLSNLD